MTEERAADPDPHDRLGAAVRALSDVVVRTGAPASDLSHAAATVETLAGRLAGTATAGRVHDSPYHPMSLVGGTAHPIAPQLHTAPSGAGIAGRVVLGPAYEGGPGLAHGGILSLLFDHAMGQAVFVAGHSAMTAKLEVRYRAPTPIEQPLTLRAWVERTSGRKVFVLAEISVAGRVTAEASGLFLQLTAANVAQIFPTGRVPDGPPPGGC